MLHTIQLECTAPGLSFFVPRLLLMAQRPIWRGHLRLALVSCPVALYTATHDLFSIRFNLINPETGNRIRMVTLDAETDKEVQRRDVRKR